MRTVSVPNPQEALELDRARLEKRCNRQLQGSVRVATRRETGSRSTKDHVETNRGK